MTLSIQCNSVDCHYTECHYAECRYAEYADCHYADCHYAELLWRHFLSLSGMNDHETTWMKKTNEIKLKKIKKLGNE
jgi:hypothetical protein